MNPVTAEYWTDELQRVNARLGEVRGQMKRLIDRLAREGETGHVQDVIQSWYYNEFDEAKSKRIAEMAMEWERLKSEVTALENQKIYIDLGTTVAFRKAEASE